MVFRDSPPENWRFFVDVPEEPLLPSEKNWSLDFQDLIKLDGGTYRCVSPVEFSARTVRNDGAVRISLRLSFRVETECSRCLVPLEVAIGENFEYCYVSQPDEEESEDVELDEVIKSLPQIGKTIDISGDLWECFVVSMPLYPVCPEGCDPIGPSTTREEGEAADPRFQILADKFGSSSGKGGKIDGNSKVKGISSQDS
ncbi:MULTISPECIES: YceD family protein [Dethiosulfovibrio]|uniref:DUF177 domain-containing protein n=2 Tax=Dethiosulfovibrio TaxID=47054 RepID=A0ABS9ELD4_9BACT|nr:MULTISPECIES: DUF177 domain-containing protein [Dethiosulfovibrio]MCF4113490.1 DUF177 domain-containing protein [Dethiosulfovibrio russensis]MCF4141960.1 DUF177 domain-containing protein [Dethiosulfovibrio marinus]MCF4144115.1 DUF177 domain-containing protein [Dethiosulfovibrio acidaminovorans]